MHSFYPLAYFVSINHVSKDRNHIFIVLLILRHIKPNIKTLLRDINSNRTLSKQHACERVCLLARIVALTVICPVSLLNMINEPNKLGLADELTGHSECGPSALHLQGNESHMGDFVTVLCVLL